MGVGCPKSAAKNEANKREGIKCSSIVEMLGFIEGVRRIRLVLRSNLGTRFRRLIRG